MVTKSRYDHVLARSVACTENADLYSATSKKQSMPKLNLIHYNLANR